jgi:glycosyltransferase involved in cell wall biosynthesis
VLEYFAMGLPAVLSPSAARGLEADAQGAFVEADTSTDWVRALTHLAADPAGANAMATRARRYVEQHHDWDRLGARLVQSIGQLLARRRA